MNAITNKKIRTYGAYMKTYFPKKYADERLALRYLRDHGAIMEDILRDARRIYETEIEEGLYETL